MRRLLFVPALLLFACDQSTPCSYLRRCNDVHVERCIEGSGPVVEETCGGPNRCVTIGDDFAACGIPTSDGGATECDGTAACLSVYRRVCATSPLKPDVSWVTAEACASGKRCLTDGGSSECL